MKVFGLLPYVDESEITPATGSFDPAFIRTMAETYDALGYERVLIAQ